MPSGIRGNLVPVLMAVPSQYGCQRRILEKPVSQPFRQQRGADYGVGNFTELHIGSVAQFPVGVAPVAAVDRIRVTRKFIRTARADSIQE